MLDIDELSITFSDYSKGLSRISQPTIHSLDLQISAGEVLAIVGQSGSGKSLLAHALLGVLPKNAKVSGHMMFKGKNVTPASIKSMHGRDIALIPQSVTYLNPLRSVGAQITRAAELSGIHPKTARQRSYQELRRYHLDEKAMHRFPFQLSGGMARRILTAMATIKDADLILADEPTQGLDSNAVAETLHHLRELANQGKAVIMITHDIEAALEVSDRVSVFCGGYTVEEAFANDFLRPNGLRHPYSKALWDALPGRHFVDVEHSGKKTSFDRGGCPFIEFCTRYDSGCHLSIPSLRPLKNGRVRCYHA